MAGNSLVKTGFLFSLYVNHRQPDKRKLQPSRLAWFMLSCIADGSCKTLKEFSRLLIDSRYTISPYVVITAGRELLQSGYVRRYRTTSALFYWKVTAKGLAALAAIEADLAAIHERGYLYEPPKDQEG